MPKKSKDENESKVKLVDGKHVSAMTFESLFYASVNHYLIEVYDDKYKAMGLAVTEARGRFLPDEAGAFVKLKYLGSNNEHYQWYIDNEGKTGGLPSEAYHHFCKGEPKSCKAKVNDREVIHVRRWSPIDKSEAHGFLVSWGFPGLPAPVAGTTKVEDDDEDDEGEISPATTPKTRPDLPRCRKRKEPDEEGDDEPPVETRGEKARKDALRKTDPERHRNALDEMLDDEPDEKAQKGLEDKLSSLREKLRGKTSGDAGGSRKPVSILAKRASEAAGTKKKRKRRSSKSGGKVIAELTKAISRKRRRSDDSRESYDSTSDGLVEDEDSRRGGGWEERRKKYKRIAEQSPGKLMIKSLESMQEQLGATFGEMRGDEEKLSPVVTRYLLTVIIPALGAKTLQTQHLREMRTIALAVDMLLKGRPDSCGDVLLQRFKSLCMQARDHSDKFGPHLELLPEDLLYGCGSNAAESAYAREMALKEAKSEDLLRQARSSKQG